MRVVAPDFRITQRGSRLAAENTGAENQSIFIMMDAKNESRDNMFINCFTAFSLQ